jgi:glycosyltransferase involved in cell wall biosynthesis
VAAPLVSVVVPTFNRAYCIGDTVDSVLAQTYRDLEIVLVDDGSTDGTGELIARRYASEPRVRYLAQANQGVSGARNHGLRQARGELIALLDSDDRWHPWKLEAQVKCLQALPEAGMIWTDMDAVDPTGAIVGRRHLTTMYTAYRWFGSRDELFERSLPLSRVDAALAAQLGEPRVFVGDIFSPMILGNLVHTSTVLLRRERLERVRGFDETLRRSGEDYDFHLRTCREGPVAYLDAVSILYMRGRNDQLTVGDNSIYLAQNFLRTLTPVLARDRDRIRLPRVMIDEVLADAHGWLGERHLMRAERLAAIRHLAVSLRHKPRQPRVLQQLAMSLLPRRLVDALRAVKRRRAR